MGKNNGLPIVSDKTSKEFDKKVRPSSYINTLINNMNDKDPILYDSISNISKKSEEYKEYLYRGSFEWGLLESKENKSFEDFKNEISNNGDHERSFLFSGCIVWGLLRYESEERGIDMITVSEEAVSSGFVFDRTLVSRLENENPNVYNWIDDLMRKCKKNYNDNSLYIGLGGLFTYSLLEKQAVIDYRDAATVPEE